MASGSGPGVEWLIEKFKLDLSLVSRLGGHSQPRTHRGGAKFPGMTITMALLDAWEDLCEKHPNRCMLKNKACGKRLLIDQGDGSVIGCEYSDKDGKTHKVLGSVVLCCGGFGADFGPQGYIEKFRPDLAHLPTTNGAHCTGDAIKMAESVGAITVDMDWIQAKSMDLQKILSRVSIKLPIGLVSVILCFQVHPTGLVLPDDPDAKVKFLAAEALRGCGGLLLDK